MVTIKDGDEITNKDEKLDVSDADKSVQDRVKEEMVDEDDFAEESGDEFDSFNLDDEEDDDDSFSENDDEENNSKSESDDDDNDDEEEEESDDEEDDFSTTHNIAEDKSDKDSEDEDNSEEEESEESSDDLPKKVEGGKFDGYETFEDYKKVMNNQLTQSQAEAVSKDKKLKETEIKEEEKLGVAFREHFNKHKDFYPPEVLEAYTKFEKYGGSEGRAFLLQNPHLEKMEDSLRKISEDIPLSERFELAFNIAFGEDIRKKAEKKAVVKTEIKAQKVNKSVSQSGKSSSGSKSKYSDEQINVAKQMGVKL